MENKKSFGLLGNMIFPWSGIKLHTLVVSGGSGSWLAFTHLENIIDLKLKTFESFENFYFVLFAIAADILNEARASKSSWLIFWNWMMEFRDNTWKIKSVRLFHTKYNYVFCGACVNPYKASGILQPKWIP